VKILIIGGAGFIGGHLLKKLLNDKKISNIDIIDNFSRSKKDSFLKDLIKDKRVSILKKNIITIKENKFKKKNYHIIYKF